MTPASALLAALPLIPDGDQAREWAERELADPVYAVAEPTPFDRAARAVAEFLQALLSGSLPAGVGPWLAVAVVVLLLALVGVALAVWGRPRRLARSRSEQAELFGVADARSADDLRRDAEQAASRGDWDDAVALRFRGLARALAERTVVDPAPGATVHGFARTAAAAFPDEAAALEAAADAFDDVRYLRRPAGESAYRAVTGLDDRLEAATPWAPRPPAALADTAVPS